MNLKRFFAKFIAGTILVSTAMCNAIPAYASTTISTEAVAGEKTLRNLLETAMLPCGSTLYVWGGGWNKADTGAGIDSTTIGTSHTWKSYFQSNSGKYDYKDHKYEIHNGLDCSGFVGWTIYNTMENQSGKTGYVYKSTNTAAEYAAKGWGTYIKNNQIKKYQVGDIVSISGHVWISLGQCNDGSVLLIHSTPNAGVQISGTQTSSGGNNSEAVRIAQEAMKKYFPYWSRFYSAKTCSANTYLKGNLMRWDFSKTLKDPDELHSMTPAQVIDVLLKNRPLYMNYFDLEKDDWYNSSTEYMLEKGWMTGMGTGIFAPTNKLTRAQMIQILYNSSSQPQVSHQKVFNDVDPSAWYGSAVEWAAENNIAAGVGNNCFAPNEPITREQMVTFLSKYSKQAGVSSIDSEDESILDPYVDKDTISPWAKQAMIWAVQQKIITGTSSKTLSAKSTATRAECAQVIFNFKA